jgi:hydrogenase expression/formation protein HypD
VVFFAVGFETTAPINAMSVLEAKRQQLSNFSILVSQFRVPPALEAVLGSPQRRVDGVLAAGHVCAVMGVEEYHPLAQRHGVPIVVAGFEPQDLLSAVLRVVQQLEAGCSDVENAYERIVRNTGNPKAQAVIREVFEIRDRTWRGIGVIPQSGLELRAEYEAFDATRRFDVAETGGIEDPECCSGLVLQGLLKPRQCPAFRVRCTPDQPLGATMVSHEGACAAYYRFRKD